MSGGYFVLYKNTLEWRIIGIINKSFQNGHGKIWKRWIFSNLHSVTFWLKRVWSFSSHKVGCSSSNFLRMALIIVSRRNSDLFFTLYLLQYIPRALISGLFSIRERRLVLLKRSSLWIACRTAICSIQTAKL